ALSSPASVSRRRAREGRRGREVVRTHLIREGRLRQTESSCRDTAKSFTPGFHLRANHIAHFADLGQFLLGRSRKARWVGESPVKPFASSGKHWTPLGTGFVANRDDVIKPLARFDETGNSLGLVSGNVDACFAHDFDDKRIQAARFDAGAAREKVPGAKFVQE